MQACLGPLPSGLAKYCPIISGPLVAEIQPYPLPEKKWNKNGGMTISTTLKASTVFLIVTDPLRGILFQEVFASLP